MLPKTAYDVVVATVADYERMRKLVEGNSISIDKVGNLTRKLAAIEDAMLAVCDGEEPEAARALMRDIAYRRGYERSEAKKYYPAVATFERRKRDLINMIAKMLGII